MSRFSEAHQDGYEAALVSLLHTPVRFLPAAIEAVALKYGEDEATVRADLMDAVDKHDPDAGAAL
jgi:hypothetical protein